MNSDGFWRCITTMGGCQPDGQPERGAPADADEGIPLPVRELRRIESLLECCGPTGVLLNITSHADER